MSQKAIVIGAGLGGLSSAMRLRALGYEVTVLEANDQPGGRASVTRQDGFSFDMGPTVVTAPYLFDELFALFGVQTKDVVEMMPVDPYYRVEFDDGSRFDYVGDQERIVEQIREMSPGDVDGYMKLAAHAERIFDIGYSELADAPFDRVTDMLRVVPDLIKLENYKTVYSLVSKYIKDERLRQVFTFQPLLVGGNPFATTSIYMLIHWLERKWGVHYAKGGTAAIVKAMVDVLEANNVEVRCSSPVSEIEVHGGKTVAVHSDGKRIPCDLVVANGDPATIYKRLVAPEHRKKHTDGSIRRKRQSMSLFVAYFGTKKQYPDIKHHTIVLGPRYKGLLDDIFNKRRLADDFSLYLHRPTASDPSMAPKNHDAFYVLSPVPNQKSGIDWAVEHERYKNRIYEALEKHLPNLRDNIVTDLAIDPRYFEGHYRSQDGSAFGLEPVFRQSAWFRYHNRSEDIRGLYFVGASTHPGAGMPGVLNSAKVLEKLLPPLSQNERVPLR